MADPMESIKASSKTSRIRRNFPDQLERQTERVQPGTFMMLALGSIVASAIIALITPRKTWASFIGLWAPSLLLFGIYGRLSRIEHGEQTQGEAAPSPEERIAS